MNVDFFAKLTQTVASIAYHARSLIYDVDSNTVESYNSIIAKFVGGKRVNFTSRNSYEARCSAALVSWNTKSPHCTMHKILCSNRSPTNLLKKFEERRRAIITKNAKKRLQNKNMRTKKKRTIITSDPDYGEDCDKPDMSPKTFEIKRKEFLKSLERNENDLKKLEMETRYQADSSTWLEERRKILTASNFYSVCRRRATTSCANLVKNILYNANTLYAPAIDHGKQNEIKAIKKLEEQENINIEKCGLFIHKNISFLGATPDGIVQPDKIVEVKCPFSAYNKSVEDAIRDKNITILKFDGHNITLNETDKWYYQIQGQLQVTGRNVCILGIWTGEDFPITVRYVHKDDEFWQKNMVKKLVQFYENCMLPELVDSRVRRNMPIRDPDYIVAAQKERDLKKSFVKKVI